MKINRAARQGRNSPPRNSPWAGLGAATLALLAAGCASQAVIPPAPVRPAPAAPPPSAPLPMASAPADWRDLPQTPGTWRYANGLAQFGQPGVGAVFAMECRQGQVTLRIAGAASQPVPATITTTSQQRAMSAVPLDTQTLAITLPARDNLLDAMAFSRGRFMVDVNGLPALVLPAWAEVGRVVEDCR
ncbi:hypothetical protein [Novosphingobium capsulatum]|uniref:hypothetical protein n=1 Tax=Novosphingobium capsulatum TaxID=13688 RepID=UPI0007883CD5|nr:hypothetical protein [Novosphingobium capsulatum]WQD94256.1 hypothetical protein U0041_06640 [Novosphingobium capsulatum]